MEQNSVFKEVLREYERDRGAAAQLLSKRREEVYTRIPRVKEIEDALTASGLDLTKAILSNGTNLAFLCQELEEVNKVLNAEKEKLMKEMGFPEDYFINIYKCGTCRDTGYYIAEPGKRCFCMQQKLIEKYYELSNLQAALKEENFDTFDIKYYSDEVSEEVGISPKQNMERIYKICDSFVKNFGNDYINLLFYGKTGLGKTFLCNCIAKDLLDRGVSVLYVTAPQLFKTIENYRFNRDEMEAPQESIGIIYSVDLLIIDDLGTEFSTVVTNAEFFNIINIRLLGKKPVIISTNLYPNDFESYYSDRITSRFFGNYRMMKFIGEDIRILKKYR